MNSKRAQELTTSICPECAEDPAMLVWSGGELRAAYCKHGRAGALNTAAGWQAIRVAPEVFGAILTTTIGESDERGASNEPSEVGRDGPGG